ncbi:HTH_Tnp_Tc3_2 domain-containing protein [Trichonephila clavipes]|nr:HTH_Tnp_Tc3_2 domain-containing protein [Trichonephila clavipes]
MTSGSYNAPELRSQQVSIRSNSQSGGENFCCIEILDTFAQLKKMPYRWIRAHYEQLSEFERGPIIGLREGDWANWRIAGHMDRSDAAIRRCWQEWVDSDRFQRHDGSGRPSDTVDQKDRLIVR